MYERMLDRNSEPDLKDIKTYLGDKSFALLIALEEYLHTNYQLLKKIRFPFGKSYGWGYKYNHKSTHLCYAFFEKEAFTVTIQIGDKQVKAFKNLKHLISDKAQKLWENRYLCGDNGGWIHYRVLSREDLDDVYKFLSAKLTIK